MYKQSQLQFYYNYINRQPATDQVPEVYGLAGNVVHNSVEKYIKNNNVCFSTLWDNAKIDDKRGINNSQLNKSQYQDMFFNAKEHVDKLKDFTLTPERRIEQEFYGWNFKGFVDISFSDEKGNLCYLDWKTNSTHSYEMHKQQRLFYSWLTWKVYNKIPRCNWIYLRTNTIHDDYFTEKELKEFDLEIQQFLKDIEKKGDDINQYDIGQWKTPFNQHASLCATELQRRIDKPKQKITIRCNGAIGHIDSDVDTKLLQGIDMNLKFDLKDKFFMQKHAKQYGRGIIDLDDVGTYHQFSMKYKIFPIGCLPTVKKVIQEYAEYYGKECIIDIQCEIKEDKRLFDERETTITLYEYQKDAIKEFDKHKYGVLHMATGSGKTFVAAHIINAKGLKTLWIIDRRELLVQTKDELEKVLGFEVGVIQGAESGTEFDVCIATVQTLHKRKKFFTRFFEEIQFCVVDEYHKAAAETYKDVLSRLKNTQYRLGLCLDENTLINTPNGKKQLKQLKRGDIVKSFNFKTKEIEHKKITTVWSTEKEQYIIKINTPSGPRKIICSGDHKILVNGKFRKAKDLNNGETVLITGDKNAN